MATWERTSQETGGGQKIFCGMQYGGDAIYCGQEIDGDDIYCGMTLDIWVRTDETDPTET